ncbi:hypothetical protein AGLY_002652 [Aphis glycines]|uniref:Uncharacterized protein n=1 Tax=Aphis glycines TaxID=307491 RepID=A0A6G0U0V2_APHGL|nr:hypothetical protein AGLY_002652 [Aphis glycines]
MVGDDRVLEVRYKDNVYYEITAEQCTGCSILGGAGGGMTAALTIAGQRVVVRVAVPWVSGRSRGWRWRWWPPRDPVTTIVGPSGSDDVKSANLIIFTSADQVIKPNLTKKNSIIIFDDVICDPQSVIKKYFSICRHSGASSVFYLAQTYSKIPKQLNLRHLFNDHSSADMDFSEFRKISNLCWSHNDYGFMVIDKTREMTKREEKQKKMEIRVLNKKIRELYKQKERRLSQRLFSLKMTIPDDAMFSCVIPYKIWRVMAYPFAYSESDLLIMKRKVIRKYQRMNTTGTGLIEIERFKKCSKTFIS